MPEFTIHLDDPQDTIANLRQAGGIGLVEQIERQLPKAPVEEPTAFGSVVRAGFDEYSDRILWQRGPKGGWTGEDGAYQGFFGALHEPEVLRVGVGEPAASPVEAVARDGVLWGPHGRGYSTSANNGLSFAEPAPEQVEVEAVCNCDYVARGGPGATPERPVEHHPLCDINLPADKRSGTPKQVEADLVQDEQAHTRYYAEGDAIEALVQQYAAHDWSDIPEVGEGAQWRYFITPSRLRAFAVRVLEVSGQQPGVPVESVRKIAAHLRLDADNIGRDIRSPRLMLENRAADLERLLPEEPTS